MHSDGTVLAETATMVGRAAAPVTVTGLTLAGLPLQEWVYVVTIIYTVLLIVHFVYKRVKEWLKK